MKKLIVSVLILVFLFCLVSCRNKPNTLTETEVANVHEDDEESIQFDVCVDWTDFIKLDGISYIGDWHMTEVSADQVGEKIGEVTCGVPKVYADGAGNVSSMEPEDGAAFLCASGTEIFSVTGNEHVIAALVDGKYYLYVSRDHSAGFVGDKLYVIVNGILMVYERYEPGIGELTKETVLGSFETQTEIEGIIWDVYSTQEYPDLSYVLVLSGTNASWIYQISDK